MNLLFQILSTLSKRKLFEIYSNLFFNPEVVCKIRFQNFYAKKILTVTNTYIGTPCSY